MEEGKRWWRQQDQLKRDVVVQPLIASDSETPWTAAPGFLHYLAEFALTHVHHVGDAIQPSCPLSSPSPPAFSFPQDQGIFPQR